MTKIKICGLSRPVDIMSVNEVLPDYVGFVFARSRRQISEETAGELRKLLHPAIKAVGVFVNEDPERIQRLCERNIIDLVQLHGEEGADYVSELRRKIDRRIIQAVRIGEVRVPESISEGVSKGILGERSEYPPKSLAEGKSESTARGEPESIVKEQAEGTFMGTSEGAAEFFGDYLLFDTYRKDQYGGSGKSFDWSMIPRTSRPYFLAGGIHSGNVEQAIRQCRPYCVDVSSGAETDGYKDAAKIREIVKKVRRLG
ncbi:phosphoribosylanthranilate isomerase [Anaerotaenia torta]|uniref:phosphoribosylanthranilate isomerase n=1 Tax=Anaerotaenia torta TaxID=433293 RepID=UPI003D1E31EE